MAAATYQTLLVDTADGITTVRLNRPEKRNAMSPQLHEDMHACLTALRDDPETRVVVITGSGGAFCAGQDLKEYFYEMRGKPREYRERIRRISMEWRQTMMRFYPKPTITAVNGWCFGGGWTFLLCSDVAIASDRAIFGLSEINFGGIPGGDVSKVISEYLQPRHAIYYSLTGETLTAEEAFRIGLVSRVVPADRLDEEVRRVAGILAKKDPRAVAAFKRVFQNIRHTDWEVSHLLTDLESQAIRMAQGGERPGIEAFVRKQLRPGLESVDVDVSEILREQR
jgi:trans-feruloyl-CoA hydratase/vanillin synthase